MAAITGRPDAAHSRSCLERGEALTLRTGRQNQTFSARASFGSEGRGRQSGRRECGGRTPHSRVAAVRQAPGRRRPPPAALEQGGIQRLDLLIAQVRDLAVHRPVVLLDQLPALVGAGVGLQLGVGSRPGRAAAGTAARSPRPQGSCRPPRRSATGRPSGNPRHREARRRPRTSRCNSRRAGTSTSPARSRT